MFKRKIKLHSLFFFSLHTSLCVSFGEAFATARFSIHANCAANMFATIVTTQAPQSITRFKLNTNTFYKTLTELLISSYIVIKKKRIHLICSLAKTKQSVVRTSVFNMFCFCFLLKSFIQFENINPVFIVEFLYH